MARISPIDPNLKSVDISPNGRVGQLAPNVRSHRQMKRNIRELGFIRGEWHVFRPLARRDPYPSSVQCEETEEVEQNIWSIVVFVDRTRGFGRSK